MMLCMLEELQSIVKARNPKLVEMEDEPLALKRRIEKPEQKVKEMFLTSLSQDTQCEEIPISSPNSPTCLGPLSPASELTEEFNDETNRLQRLWVSTRSLLITTFYTLIYTPFLTYSVLFFLWQSVENLGSEEYSGYEQRER